MSKRMRAGKRERAARKKHKRGRIYSTAWLSASGSLKLGRKKMLNSQLSLFGIQAVADSEPVKK